MKEIITINVGGCGMKIGNQILSQYVDEHQLNKQSEQTENTAGQSMDNHVMFQQLSNGSNKFRCINIDFEQDTLNDILTNNNKHFYRKQKCIGSKQSSGGIFSKGKTIAKKQLIEPFEDEFRKVSQNCDSLQGVIFNCSSLGGGAGLLHETSLKIAEDLAGSKVPKIGNILFPSNRFSNSVVQIYNYTLSSAVLLNYLDLVIPFDNQTLYTTCEEYLDIDKPSYPEINQMIAQVNSSVTLSMRHTSILNSKLNDLLTNLICYPRIHFLYPSFVGFKQDKRNKYCFQNDYLTKNILDVKARLVNMTKVSKKITIGLFYRGNIGPYEIHQSLNKLKKQNYYNIEFEEWSPLGFKISVDNTPLNKRKYGQGSMVNSLLSSPSCCALTSSMEYYQFFGSHNHKFDRLFSHRSFVHHYISDIEEGEFVEARQDFAAIQKDYEPMDGCCYYEEEEQGQIE